MEWPRPMGTGVSTDGAPSSRPSCNRRSMSETAAALASAMAAGVSFSDVLRAAAHEPVAGVRIDDCVVVMSDDLVDVLGRDPHVLAAKEQQGGAVGRPEFAGDRAPIESDSGVEALGLYGHAVRQPAAHAETGNADLGRAEVAEDLARGFKVGSGFLRLHGADEVDVLGGLRAPHAEEQVGSNG